MTGPRLTERHPVLRVLFIALGWVFVALGVIGLLLPVVPATPFLLVAAFLFDRSSPRFHRMLLDHRVVGPYLRSLSGKRPMPARQKAATIALMWILLAFTLVFFVKPWWGRAAMLLVTGSVTVYLLRLPATRRTSGKSAGEAPAGTSPLGCAVPEAGEGGSPTSPA